jgi:putative SOS response-associated peptidase YedK
MCSHYQAIKERTRLEKLGVAVPDGWSPPAQLHIYKRYLAPIIRLTSAKALTLAESECIEAEFGLLPHWSQERQCKFETLNARAETAASTPSYRRPWAERHCIIPADWINEPDWRSGRAVDTAIARADGEPMGIAGLWDAWRDPVSGQVVRSFTMLTINADAHLFMNQFHRPGKEKRMVVVLPESLYDDWLRAGPAHSMDFMKPFPAEALVVRPGERPPGKKAIAPLKRLAPDEPAAAVEFANVSAFKPVKAAKAKPEDLSLDLWPELSQR